MKNIAIYERKFFRRTTSDEKAGKVIAYPPIPEKRIGTGHRFFKDAMRREPMVSPETSPATMKTLSSPSFTAISITALPETDTYLLINLERPTSLPLFNFHIVLNNISKIS
jgi:hypothetical protein